MYSYCNTVFQSQFILYIHKIIHSYIHHTYSYVFTYIISVNIFSPQHYQTCLQQEKDLNKNKDL